MKTFQINYSMELLFSKPVEHHYFTLKCLPKTQPRQQVISNKIYVNSEYFSLSQDCFRNNIIYGNTIGKHDTFSVSIRSVVQVDWTQYDRDDSLLPVFLKQTEATSLSSHMKQCLVELELLTHGLNTYEKAIYFSKYIFEYMTYEKGATGINTSGKMAFENKKGVCQDYAHILIGFLRESGIPARYVAGIMNGEKYTHAWVEFYANGYWYGTDPTNNLLIDDNYVIFSKGRDHKDTLINKGVFYGMNVSQKQNIEISIEEVIYD
ncbi:MAG: transglutaminase family protein [Bacillota bacterium]|nr:transglutaminase family protein [Bacillota bacterium]